MIVCDISDDGISSSIPKGNNILYGPIEINNLKITRINHAILQTKAKYTSFNFNIHCCKEVQEILLSQPKMLIGGTFRDNSYKPKDLFGNYYNIDFFESNIEKRINFVDGDNNIIDHIIIDTIGKKQRRNNTIDDILKD
jgi:hypothetical protein